MLNRTFAPNQPHTYVRYTRMSTEMQNPRSPEQQHESIDLALRRAGYSWTHAADYRDNAISGRFVTKRPGLQQMLNDLRSGRVKADLILVDTYERLGRADEITSIRQQLQAKNKILVLTADSGFADPTSTAGRALTVLESIRSTEDGRIKAHNILRGKRDLATRGRWPGGPVPTGLKLDSIMVEKYGRTEVDGHRLVPDPATRIAPTRAFALALEKGWGSRLIARELNADPDIPIGLKPISDEKVRLWLKNPLFKGVLIYGIHHTGIVNDKYVREKADADELVIVEKFCEPLVTAETFDEVNRLRRLRNESKAPRPVTSGASDPDDSGEVIPEARKYLLTGLVRCGQCGGQMDLTSNTRTRADGVKDYRYYKCRGYATGACTHRSGFREEVLKQVVVAKLRFRLFPPRNLPESVPDWLPRLTDEVRRRIDALSQSDGDPRPSHVAELAQLDDQIRGWSMSLGNSRLPASTRASLEDSLNEALERQRQVQTLLNELEATRTHLDELLDHDEVLDRLRRLDEVLANGNVAQGNRELRRVIKRVVCHADGRVELQTNPLGLFDGITSWLKPTATSAGSVMNQASLYWTDPVEYIKPPRAAYRSWPRDHAAEVLAKRQETGWSIRRLSHHFKKSWGTIDEAIKLAGPVDSPSTPTDQS